MTRFAVEHEMAQHLVDVYRRRTDLMLFRTDNGRGWLRALAADMAALLGWFARRADGKLAVRNSSFSISNSTP